MGCAGAALVAAGCGLTSSSAKTTTVTATVTRTVTATQTVTTSGGAGASSQFCTADDVHATFQVLDGSAGAGNIVYTLTLTNTGVDPCAVEGVPSLQLLDAKGNAAPTHVTPSQTTKPVFTMLQVGDSASSQIRFSPDVDPCNVPTSTQVVVRPNGGGTLTAPVEPATRVCQDGAMQATNFTTAD